MKNLKKYLDISKTLLAKSLGQKSEILIIGN